MIGSCLKKSGSLFMHTGTPRKMPANLAGARRASREDALPYSIAQPRIWKFAVSQHAGRAASRGEKPSPARSHYVCNVWCIENNTADE